jgi:branched-chain amino acid transport system ATP-binding protein
MAATPDPSPVLDARSLVAGYQRDINILSGVSVRAWAGRIACVLGPNGTGKSTLLKTIFGFLRPIEGQVVYRGGDITGLAPHRMISRGITYLPQQPSLFPYLSVEINLRLGLWHARARDAAERIERAFGQFTVLREKRRQPAGQLSGGQQRQLEIARARGRRPDHERRGLPHHRASGARGGQGDPSGRPGHQAGARRGRSCLRHP